MHPPDHDDAEQCSKVVDATNVCAPGQALQPLRHPELPRVKKEWRCADSDSDEEGPAARLAFAEPRAVFEYAQDGGERSLHTVWNCVLFNDTPGSSARQAEPDAGELQGALMRAARDHARWAVVLSRGGHFAAAIFHLKPQQRQGDEWAVALHHKTFHRCGK